MYADSHLHTAFSGDSETPPAAQNRTGYPPRHEDSLYHRPPGF